MPSTSFRGLPTAYAATTTLLNFTDHKSVSSRADSIRNGGQVTQAQGYDTVNTADVNDPRQFEGGRHDFPAVPFFVCTTSSTRCRRARRSYSHAGAVHHPLCLRAPPWLDSMAIQSLHFLEGSERTGPWCRWPKKVMASGEEDWDLLLHSAVC